jgi:hypothetical protein
VPWDIISFGIEHDTVATCKAGITVRSRYVRGCFLSRPAGIGKPSRKRNFCLRVLYPSFVTRQSLFGGQPNKLCFPLYAQFI